MASGFDSSAFNTGLLNGITRSNNQAQADIHSGDAEQYRQFLEASHEYDGEKAKLADQSAKIDAMANILSSGNPNPAAYATARDAVEMGYTGQEHLPYVQDAYKRTMQDYIQNPDKWSGVKQQAQQEDAAKFGPDEVQDSNPNQTNIMRHFGDQTPLQDIENVRQHKLDRPYSNLPGGEWSDEDKVALSQEAAKQKQSQQIELAGIGPKVSAEAAAKQGVSDAREAKQASDLGLDSSASPQTSSMPSTGMNQEPPNSADVTTSQLAVPPEYKAAEAAQGPPVTEGMGKAPAPATEPPGGGIAINAAPPPENQQTQSLQTPPDASAPPQSGVNEEYMKQLEAKNPTAAGMVKQIASGELQISPWMLRDRSDGSKSSWYDMIAAAHKYDPSFDMTDYNARNKMHTSYTAGTDHQNIMRIGTAAGHLGELYLAGKDLDTGNIQGINKVAQGLGIATGQTPAQTYQAIAIRVSPEIVTAYTPTGGSDQDRENSVKSFAAQMSGPQREDVLRATASLLNSRMQALQNNWDTNMGPSKAGKDFYDPNTHAVMKALGVNEADKTPFTTMQQLEQQGQHPLNPNLNKAAPAQQSGQDWSHLWSQ